MSELSIGFFQKILSSTWMQTKHLVKFAFSIYILVVILNPGFMGTDEYWTGITRYIPALHAQLNNLVTAEDVKSPLQIMPMHGAAQLAYALGVDAPFQQYHFVVILIGLINFLILLGSFNEWKKEFNESQGRLIFVLLIFYFAAPFAFSRPMFESLAAPWLSWSALMAYRYDQRSELKNLLWGVLFISVSFCLRPQTGFCALFFIFAPLYKKDFKGAFLAAALGSLFLALSGLPDLWLRGAWHFSLIYLVQYNFQHGNEYGSQPWTFYPLMLMAMTFSPLLIHQVSKEWIKKYAAKYRSVFVFVILFVFVHSLFSQKFERFLIPLLPLVFILMVPWLESMIQKNHNKRLIAFVMFNGFLWLAASFQPAQNNIIQMAQYLDQHSEIRKIFRVEQTPEWIPEAFIANKQFQFIDIKPEEISKVVLSCSDRMILSETNNQQAEMLQKNWFEEAQFTVNWIEWVSYHFNPKNNLRRTKLSLWSPLGCEG